MGPGTGPETLRAVAERLRAHAQDAEVDALLFHADAWEAERAALAEQLSSERRTNARLTDELAAAQKRVDVLEQDRKWWQDNAIRRHKRAEARRSRRTSSDRGRS